MEAQEIVGFNYICWKVVPFNNCSWENIVLTDGLMMLYYDDDVLIDYLE